MSSPLVKYITHHLNNFTGPSIRTKTLKVAPQSCLNLDRELFWIFSLFPAVFHPNRVNPTYIKHLSKSIPNTYNFSQHNIWKLQLSSKKKIHNQAFQFEQQLLKFNHDHQHLNHNLFIIVGKIHKNPNPRSLHLATKGGSTI